MAQRALIGLDLLALQRAAMDDLCLAGAPAGPDQARSFFAGQPALARPALLRQRHMDHGMVQVLTGMMPDRVPLLVRGIDSGMISPEEMRLSGSDAVPPFGFVGRPECRRACASLPRHS